jgi:hypothetical protein
MRLNSTICILQDTLRSQSVSTQDNNLYPPGHTTKAKTRSTSGFARYRNLLYSNGYYYII